MKQLLLDQNLSPRLAVRRADQYPGSAHASEVGLDRASDRAVWEYARRKFEQEIILDGSEDQLRHEPSVETSSRKRLRPNDISQWELRLGRYRVFYDVEEPVKVVAIQAIGFKDANRLYIRGESVDL